ncbi:predicted protein [Histoplasma capsulatum var. duboisii H88]|uniref:Predicted protein n=1 Tax=Ajellomyces capsulatus (strain H88) TaxID=544711 RepID=F0U7N6_AJEC8|nr:predicted protein [Histoplasma capsulatum var. duboisii H88]
MPISRTNGISVWLYPNSDPRCSNSPPALPCNMCDSSNLYHISPPKMIFLSYYGPVMTVPETSGFSPADVFADTRRAQGRKASPRADSPQKEKDFPTWGSKMVFDNIFYPAFEKTKATFLGNGIRVNIHDCFHDDTFESFSLRML